MKNINKHLDSIFAVLLIVGVIGFGAWLRGVNANLSHKLTVTESELALARNQSAELSDALTNSLNTIGTLEEQLRGLSTTVGSLIKLRDTDPELLQKYSKVYFLPDTYMPRGLVSIDDKYLLDPSRDLQFHGKATDKLYRMMEDARSSGLDLHIASAYRSFAQQNDLKAAYKVTYGAGTANSFSADQGYSEHQLGTTVDFTTKKIGGGLAGFDKTAEYEWLLKNAYKYGFILSYPKGNPYYVFEPWHWRFVGVSLANRLHEESEDFVDLTQRQIDPYLINIFN